MKMKKFIKRITVLGMVAALIASGPVLNVRAAPNGNPGEKDSVEMPELIEIDQSYSLQGFLQKYQVPQQGRTSCAIYFEYTWQIYNRKKSESMGFLLGFWGIVLTGKQPAYR